MFNTPKVHSFSFKFDHPEHGPAEGTAYVHKDVKNPKKSDIKLHTVGLAGDAHVNHDEADSHTAGLAHDAAHAHFTSGKAKMYKSEKSYENLEKDEYSAEEVAAMVLAKAGDMVKAHKDTLNALSKSDNVVIPKKEFIKEHKNLLQVLRSKSHKDDKQEANKQGSELIQEMNKARVDQGMMPSGKVALREQRNDRKEAWPASGTPADAKVVGTPKQANTMDKIREIRQARARFPKELNKGSEHGEPGKNRPEHERGVNPVVSVSGVKSAKHPEQDRYSEKSLQGLRVRRGDMEGAKKAAKEILSEQKSMKKPNLPKSENMTKNIDKMKSLKKFMAPPPPGTAPKPSIAQQINFGGNFGGRQGGNNPQPAATPVPIKKQE